MPKYSRTAAPPKFGPFTKTPLRCQPDDDRTPSTHTTSGSVDGSCRPVEDAVDRDCSEHSTHTDGCRDGCRDATPIILHPARDDTSLGSPFPATEFSSPRCPGELPPDAGGGCFTPTGLGEDLSSTMTIPPATPHSVCVPIHRATDCQRSLDRRPRAATSHSTTATSSAEGARMEYVWDIEHGVPALPSSNAGEKFHILPPPFAFHPEPQWDNPSFSPFAVRDSGGRPSFMMPRPPLHESLRTRYYRL